MNRNPTKTNDWASGGPQLSGLRLRPITALRLALLAMTVVSLAGRLYAQTVTFAGAQTAIAATGLNLPEGVAIDQAGDVFIADTQNNRVVEVPTNGGAQIVVGNGLQFPGGIPLNAPSGLAVDGAGDVFIADTPNGRVVEVPAGGGAPVALPTVGLVSPRGLAVDAAGDLFIVDISTNVAVELPAGGGPQVTLPIQGLNNPAGIAVDLAGDVFVADTGNSRIVELPFDSGAGVPVTITGLTLPLNEPGGVAVDSARNLFISDFGNGRIVEVPAGGGAAILLPIANLGTPSGVAADSSGDLFISEYSNSSAVEFQLNSVNFGNVNVCAVNQTPAPCTGTLTLNFSLTGNPTLNTVVSTNGAQGLDFALAATPASTCNGAVTAATCTVSVTFGPLTAGVRPGAVTVTAAGQCEFLPCNLPHATVLLSGTGLAPQAALLPGDEFTMAPATANTGIHGVAVDASGTIYYSDQAGNNVYKVVNGATTPLTFANGVTAPGQLAVDGSGAVYVLSAGSQIIKLASNGVQSTLVSNNNYPDGLTSITAFALDGQGDIFVVGPSVDFGGLVEKLGTNGVFTRLGSNFLALQAVAVGPGGIPYVVDFDTATAQSKVYSIPAANQTKLLEEFDEATPYVTSMVVDAGGSVYTPENALTAPFSLGYLGTLNTQGILADFPVQGLDVASQLAMDSKGNLYIANTIGTQQQNPSGNIIEIFRTAGALDFGSSPLNTTAGPLSVTMSNIGNEPMNIFSFLYTGDTSGVDFAEYPLGGIVPAECTQPQTLAAGTTCQVNSAFEPLSGPGLYTGELTFADTSLNAGNNAPTAQQVVSLDGAGTAPQLTPTTLTLAANPTTNSAFGQPVTLTATLTPFQAAGLTTNGEPITFESGGTPLGTAALTNGVATFIATALPAGGSALTAVYDGDANFATSTSNQISYFVLQPATTSTALAITSGGNAVTTVAAGTVVTLTATVTAANTAPVTLGLVSFCDASAATCEGAALLGTSPLTQGGIATLRLIPAIGVHSYQAIFSGTTGVQTSDSAPVSLIVTGLYPTTTTIAAAGAPGNYTLTGTVVGTGSPSLAPGGSLSFLDTTNGNASVGTAVLGAATAGLSFANQNNPYTVGPGGNSVVTADFNGDGKLDLAVASSGPNTRLLTILAGDGAGNFATTVASAQTPEVTALAVGDFNGDGIPDLAISRHDDNLVEIDLGNGTGVTITTPFSTSETGLTPVSPVVADFNGDGRLDVAVANSGGNTVTVLLGNGDGTLTPAAGTPGATPAALAVGDFNGDSLLDLVVVNSGDNTVTVLLGNGDGTFTASAAVPPATGFDPVAVAVGDFNGDGKPDLAIANNGDSNVTLLLGTGDGSFTPSAEPFAPSPSGPVLIVTGDFNGDGKVDLAVANNRSSSIAVLLGNGDGTFTPAAGESPGTGATPAWLTSADVNGDGAPDLITANNGTNLVTVLLTQQTQTATATLANVSIPGAGTHDVEASYRGDTNFGTSVSTTVPLTGSGAALTPQTITFAPIAAQIYGAAAFAVTATASSALPVTITVQSGPATIAGNVVTITGVGAVVLAANQAGNANYLAAPTVTQGFTVTPAVLTVTANPLTILLGQAIPTLTDTITGFVYNDTAPTAVTGAAALATTATAASPAGSYPITVAQGTLAAANYTFTFVPGTLTIVQALSLTPVSLTFADQTPGTQSAAQIVTLTNTSDTAYVINQIILDLGLNPSDFTQTNNCPATLEGGASCQISVVFAPNGVGPKSAALLVADNSPVPQQSVNLTGTGSGGILQVNPGNLKTIAGNGTAGYSGDNGSAILAELNDPDGISFDTLGNLYIADVVNNVIRKVDTLGNITTVAGNGTPGFSGDGGPATNAQLNGPFGVVPDTAGNIYVLDALNNRIRKVDTAGTITTFAGTGVFGFFGDGGPATAAQLGEVQGARFDAAGNLYVPQCGDAAIRKIDTNGIITTVAGNGTDGFSGDGGVATAAQLDCPSGVAIDAAGELFIADYLNNRIRKVSATGIITTIAGNGTPGFSGDGGPAAAAEVNIPNDVEVDAAGNVYIADSGNNRVRKIDTAGIITTVVGGLNNAGSAGVNAPSGLAFDAGGNLYFSDAGNNAIREVFPAGAVVFAATPIATAATAQTFTLSNIGNLPVTIGSAASFALSGNAADFSLAGGTCLTLTAPLPPLGTAGNTCTLVVGFTPTALGTRTATISVTDDAVYSPQSFPISGSGTPATTTLAVTASSSTVVTPAPVSLTATLTTLATGATGTVTFLDGATTLGQAPLGATGTAVLNGVVLAIGSHSITASYSGAADFAAATSPAITVVVQPKSVLSLTAIAPTGVAAGAANTTITASGTNFDSTSVVNFNGAALATTFVSATQLTAIIPAASLAAQGTALVTVTDSATASTSLPQTFTILPALVVTFTGPPTTSPGEQPTLNFGLGAPYSTALAGTMTLTFTPDSGNPDDPQVQFATGGRTFNFTLPANSTETPLVLVQAGTTSGTISVSLQLAANGVNVTPPSVVPISIAVPKVAPTVSAVTFSGSGDTLTVVLTGYSSTREIQSATFFFTPAQGASLAEKSVTVTANALFTTWYTGADSAQFGSSFTYTQTFILSGPATNIGGVGATLTNTIGTSTEVTSQ